MSAFTWARAYFNLAGREGPVKSKRYQAFFFLFVAILPVSGCLSARCPKFQPVEPCPQGKAVVYIYRPLISRFQASDYHLPYLFVDNKKIAPMRVGRYTWLSLEPGMHVFEIKATTLVKHVAMKTLEQLSLELEAGKEYYLDFRQELNSPSPVLTPLLSLATVVDDPNKNDPLPTTRAFWSVPKQMALPQLQKTSYMGPDAD
jgi:hypothetical protein